MFIEVCDKDDTPLDSDDLIDILPIDITVSSVMVGDESNITNYLGILGYVTVSLSFSVQCMENFQGTHCSECAPGFTGSLCEFNIDDCTGVDCSGHGQCVDGVNSFSCSCDLGFTGAMCNRGISILNIIVQDTNCYSGAPPPLGPIAKVLSFIVRCPYSSGISC